MYNASGLDCGMGVTKGPVPAGLRITGSPVTGVWLFLDQIKRDKGVWWMPWQQEAMKDVITCDKRGGAGNEL